MNELREMIESTFEKYMASHLRRIMILLIMGIFNYRILKVLGYINRMYGFLDTVFVMYPATERYALKIVYPYWRNRLGWIPRPVMLFKQNDIRP